MTEIIDFHSRKASRVDEEEKTIEEEYNLVEDVERMLDLIEQNKEDTEYFVTIRVTKDHKIVWNATDNCSDIYTMFFLENVKNDIIN